MKRHIYIPYTQHSTAGDSNRLVVFNHIMKCAGMTMLANLAGHFGSGHYPVKVDHYTDWQKLACNGFTERNEPTLSLGGHAALGIEALFPQPKQVFYVTILRKPFSLCRSLYRYSQLNFARPMTFREFVMTAYPTNLMVKTLADGDLELAKERLADHYYHFGLVERFDHSLEMLCRHLDVERTFIHSINASSRSLVPIEDDSRLEDAFMERNALDVKLYIFAVHLFEERYNRFRKFEAVSVSDQELTRNVAQAVPEEVAAPILELLRSGRIAEGVQALLALPPQRIPYREAARYLVGLGYVDDALACLYKGMTFHPWLRQHELEICETAGRLERAAECARSILNIVEPLQSDTIEDAHCNRIAYHMLMTLARLALRQGKSFRGYYAHANRIMPSRMQPRYDGMQLGVPQPIGMCLDNGGRVLVMRFGPMTVLSAFAEASRDSAADLDLLLQPSINDGVPKGAFETIFRLPEERFIFDDHLRFLPSALLTGRYESIVVILNDQDLLTYDHVFRLCGQLDCGAVYVFPMWNRLVNNSEMRIYNIDSIVARYVCAEKKEK